MNDSFSHSVEATLLRDSDRSDGARAPLVERLAQGDPDFSRNQKSMKFRQSLLILYYWRPSEIAREAIVSFCVFCLCCEMPPHWQTLAGNDRVINLRVSVSEASRVPIV